MNSADDPARRPSDSDEYYDRLYDDLREGPSPLPSTSDGEALDPSSARPERIGRYRVLGTLGVGGQAVTYRAFHPDLEKELVIKLYRHRVPEGRKIPDRFRDEARLLASIEHPNVAVVHDFDVIAGQPFVVLEFVRGRTLQQERDDGPLSAETIAARLVPIARACEAAHAAGVVHRDIKPANVVVDKERASPKLIDFGIAQLRDVWRNEDEEPGLISGTAEYMAPEQARGETVKIGPRTDVFALGGVLFFLLTGRAPFAGTSVHETLENAASCRFPRELLSRDDVPAKLAKVCSRALAAETDERFESAESFARALEAASARPLRRRVAEHRGKLVAALVVVVAIALVSAMLSDGPDKDAASRESSFEQASLAVTVERTQGAVVPIESAVPLRTGDGVVIELAIPASAGERTSVFWLDSTGQVHVLGREQARIRSGDSGGVELWSFASNLEGTTGTEMVFACSAQSRPTKREFELALADLAAPWPSMAPETGIRVDASGAHLVGLRAPGKLRAPPESAFARAQEARTRLRAKFDWVAGWVFPHRAPKRDN